MCAIGKRLYINPPLFGHTLFEKLNKLRHYQNPVGITNSAENAGQNAHRPSDADIIIIAPNKWLLRLTRHLLR